MVRALQIFTHGIEPKVRQRQHPPYMALVECDSLDFDDSITGKFPSGNVTGKSMLPVEQGANAVTLSRVLPFCVTPPDPVIQSESQRLMLRGHKEANARRAYHTPATSPRILRSGKAE